MVSTRGIKPKYDVGERVLCFEPDPKKMKMLYDARVLGVRPSEKVEGRRGGFDYFVHFLGWNATWDRHVADDMLMKDNEEGRREQNVLYQLLEAAKKSERKKKRKSTDKIRASTDSNPSPIPPECSPETKNKRLSEDIITKDSEDKFENKPKKMRTADRLKSEEMKVEKPDIKTEHDHLVRDVFQREQEQSPSQNDGEEIAEPDKKEEDICTEPVPIQFQDPLKKALEKDLRLISVGKLVKLPAQPNIVTLLEGFVRKYAINRLSAAEKQIQKNYTPYNKDKDESEYFDEVRASINLCKEVAEGFRILIDFLLGTLLLYPQERNQFSKATSIRPHMESIERLVADVSHLHPTLNLHNTSKEGTAEDKSAGKRKSSRKKEPEVEAAGGSVLPGSAGSMSSGAETPTLSTVSSSMAVSQYPQYKQSHQILTELQSWKLLPESVYFEEPAPTSLIYGGIHLTRFAVHLPQLLVNMRFPNKKVKYLTKFIEFLVDYVTSQVDETFLESVYS